ncbi:MAG TPA: transglycosylase SLT domain-containing protein [Casimicrobiaceae bacterium]|nr:transglycosylase SLT domain-containing protein [Casimicrobiaceae bacterium]
MKSIQPIVLRGSACGVVAGCAAALVAVAVGAQELPAAAGGAEEAARLNARALAYEHGEGVAQDQPRAAALYCAAARRGDAEAQFSLGWMYANGRGVAHDEGVAATLFALAAAQGHAAARQALKFVSAERAAAPDCMKPDEPPPPIATIEPPDPFANLPPEKQKIADVVTTLAPLYAVAPRLALAVISVESNFDPTARSPKDALGVMQLIPGTAARFSVRNPFDVRDNVRGGLKYLRWLLSYYRGQVALAAAAYNAGEAVVDRYRGVPPYPETESYVQKVLALFGKDEHPYDAGLAAPSPFLSRP